MSATYLEEIAAALYWSGNRLVLIVDDQRIAAYRDDRGLASRLIQAPSSAPPQLTRPRLSRAVARIED